MSEGDGELISRGQRQVASDMMSDNKHGRVRGIGWGGMANGPEVALHYGSNISEKGLRTRQAGSSAQNWALGVDLVRSWAMSKGACPPAEGVGDRCCAVPGLGPIQRRLDCCGQWGPQAKLGLAWSETRDRGVIRID